jgi:hypothetical protein
VVKCLRLANVVDPHLSDASIQHQFRAQKDTPLLERLQTNKAHGWYGFDSTNQSWGYKVLNGVSLVPIIAELYAECPEPQWHLGGTLRTQQFRSLLFKFLNDATWIRNTSVQLDCANDLNAYLNGKKDYKYKFQFFPDAKTDPIDPDSKIVFVGHSGGSLIFFDYLCRDHTKQNPQDGGNPQIIYRVKGFISFGSQISVVEASTLAKRNDSASDFYQFKQHFLQDGNFWIHITERDDPPGFSLLCDMDKHDDKLAPGQYREGFIHSYVTKRGLLDVIPVAKDLHFQDSIFMAHTWYWPNPKVSWETPPLARLIGKYYVAGFSR